MLYSFKFYSVTSNLLAYYVVGHCPKHFMCYFMYDSPVRKVCVVPILQIKQLRHRETK